MLLLPSVTHDGRTTAIDLDHIAQYVDTGSNGSTLLVTAGGHEILLKENFNAFMRRAFEAAQAREDAETNDDETIEGADRVNGDDN